MTPISGNELLIQIAAWECQRGERLAVAPGIELAGRDVGTIVSGRCNMMMDCAQFVLCNECNGRTDRSHQRQQVSERESELK